MPFLRQSTIQTIRFGPFLDIADGVTEEDALTITQALRRLSKDGGDFAQSGETGNSTHDENGWYFDDLTAADTDTVGELLLYVQDPATHLPVWTRWWVIEEAVYDAIYGAAAEGPLQGTTAGVTLDVAATGEAGIDLDNTVGDLATADFEADFLDNTLLADDVIAAEQIAADAIGASEIATGAIDADAIAADAITNAKIANDAIGATEIAVGAIAADAFVAGAIDAAAIAANAIGASELATDAIGDDQIATGAIAATAFAAGAIDAAAIAANAIGASELAEGAIDAATLAADVDVYQAKVFLIDDDGGTEDQYTVIWFLNSQPITAGITVPTIQVIKWSDGTDLIASVAMTEIASLGMFKRSEVSNRVVDGESYIAKVEATIASATRTWFQPVGRDST